MVKVRHKTSKLGTIFNNNFGDFDKDVTCNDAVAFVSKLRIH